MWAENTIKDRIVALKLLPELASRPGVPRAAAARGAFRGSAAPQRQAREHHRHPRRLAYLVDFGIANAATDEKLTELGTAVGTYAYMAPERFTSDEVTYRRHLGARLRTA